MADFSEKEINVAVLRSLRSQVASSASLRSWLFYYGADYIFGPLNFSFVFFCVGPKISAVIILPAKYFKRSLVSSWPAVSENNYWRFYLYFGP